MIKQEGSKQRKKNIKNRRHKKPCVKVCRKKKDSRTR